MSGPATSVAARMAPLRRGYLLRLDASPHALAPCVAVLAAGGRISGGRDELGEGVMFGVLAPLSGPHAADGREIVDGAKLAAEDQRPRRRGRRPVRWSRWTTSAPPTGATEGRGEKLLAEDEPRRRARRRVRRGRRGRRTRRSRRGRIPFLVSAAQTHHAIVDPAKTPSTYLLDGTPYQESLAAAHWLALEGKQLLATVFEDTAADRYLTAAAQLPHARRCRSSSAEQTVRRGRARHGRRSREPRSSRSRTSSASPARRGGFGPARRRAARRRLQGHVRRVGAVAQPRVPRRGRAKGAEGAYVVAPARPAGPARHGRTGPRSTGSTYGRAPGTDAMQSYDALRVLGQAVTQSGKVDHALNSSQLPGSTSRSTTFLGGVQFARDHTIQEDNHIILVADKGSVQTENTLRSRWVSCACRSRLALLAALVLRRGGLRRLERFRRDRATTASPSSRPPTSGAGDTPEPDRRLLGRTRVPLARRIRPARRRGGLPADPARPTCRPAHAGARDRRRRPASRPVSSSSSREDPDDHQTPKITQAAFVFGTDRGRAAGDGEGAGGDGEVPANYVVRGGPPQILGTYALNARPLEIDGWKGIAQQLAHSYQGGRHLLRGRRPRRRVAAAT